MALATATAMDWLWLRLLVPPWLYYGMATGYSYGMTIGYSYGMAIGYSYSMAISYGMTIGYGYSYGYSYSSMLWASAFALQSWTFSVL